MISEIENFEGKPNLKEFDFCALGQRFKFSSWYDVTTYEGVAKIEQNGVLLAHDEEFVFVDLRKPVFDLVVYIDQQKHQLQIFVFGLLSVQVQCRFDDAVVFGPKRLPAYASIIAPLSALASSLLKKHLRRYKQKGETPHTDMPTAAPRVKHKTKPLIRKIIKPVAAIALLITFLISGLSIIHQSQFRCVEGNCGNGLGTYTRWNGDKYVGELKDNELNGRGTLTYADGSIYVGEFKDGKYNGKGTFTFADGTIYDGEFKDDMPHGQVSETRPDGSVISSLWENGEIVD